MDKYTRRDKEEMENSVAASEVEALVDSIDRQEQEEHSPVSLRAELDVDPVHEHECHHDNRRDRHELVERTLEHRADLDEERW